MTVTEIKNCLVELGIPLPRFMEYDSSFSSWPWQKEPGDAVSFFYRWERPVGLTPGDVVYGRAGLYEISTAVREGATVKGRCEPFSGRDLVIHRWLHSLPQGRPIVPEDWQTLKMMLDSPGDKLIDVTAFFI